MAFKVGHSAVETVEVCAPSLQSHALFSALLSDPDTCTTYSAMYLYLQTPQLDNQLVN